MSEKSLKDAYESTTYYVLLFSGSSEDYYFRSREPVFRTKGTLYQEAKVCVMGTLYQGAKEKNK